jgi:site-specific recombinase XerD
MEGRLRAEGKSEATVNKYIRDVKKYFDFVVRATGSADKYCDWEILQRYREYLGKSYKLSSANSMIAGVNYFLIFSGKKDLKVKGFKTQRELVRPEELELTRDEYTRLLDEACIQENERLFLIMQTLGSTGMRVSELPYVTVESLRTKRAIVSLKGKTRRVILPTALCVKLSDYAERKDISSGSVFVTRSGRPVDRSNILHDMKRLSKKANVDPRKAFPHNLRHMFALTYYRAENDIFHLADILGHSDVNTTRIYTTVGESKIAAAIENLGLV